MKPTLTVFTPAYNRAHTIGRTYESLCRQTCKDFCWLVVDDGSTDNTRELVESWIAEGRIPIRYIYQENQGMHGAHNTAYHNIDTELNTCIDSDDWMPDDAVEKIVTFWIDHGNDKYAGIVGLDYDHNGQLLGTLFNKSELTLKQFYEEGGKGDKKLVYRTEVIKQYPDYPIFEGEKLVGLGSKYLMIDQDYKLLTLNEPLVMVEYQLDGSSMNIWRQNWLNPKGFIYYKKLILSLNPPFIKRLRCCIHFVSSKLIAREYDIISDSPSKLTTFFMLPAGLFMYLVTRYKMRHNIID